MYFPSFVFWAKSRLHYLILVLFAFLTTLPLLGPGFVLNFDMIFAPDFFIDFEYLELGILTYSNLGLHFVLEVLSWLLPVSIIQKAILLGTFTAGSLLVFKYLPVKNKNARFLGALLYMYNPFVYDRLMAGHWRFLLAYALTPLFFHFALKLFSNPGSLKLRLLAAFTWLAISIISSHHLIILGILFIFLATFLARTKKQVADISIVSGLVFIGSLWWLIPQYFNQQVTETIDTAHFLAFASSSNPDHGIWFNLISLQGFWHDGWKSLSEASPYWPVAFSLLLMLVFIGLIRSFSDNRSKRIIGALVSLSVASVIFAAGPWPSVSELNTWIFNNLPGMESFREPQKFLALLALFYAVSLSFGANFILSTFKKSGQLAATALISAAIIVFSLPIFWGGNGQLQTINYPDSWFEFKEVLEEDKSAKAIALPWYTYISDSWAGELVSQPARVFFGEQVIVGTRINLNGVSEFEPDEFREISQAVDQKNPQLLRQAASKIGAKYIIYTPDSGPFFGWLNEFEVFTRERELIIYLLTE